MKKILLTLTLMLSGFVFGSEDHSSNDLPEQISFLLARDNDIKELKDFLESNKSNKPIFSKTTNPLIALAARKNNKAAIKLLLSYEKHKPTINNTDGSSGRTGLIWASKNGYESVVKILLSEGADPDIKDGWGKTALDHASSGGFGSVTKLIRNWLSVIKDYNKNKKEIDLEFENRAKIEDAREATKKYMIPDISNIVMDYFGLEAENPFEYFVYTRYPERTDDYIKELKPWQVTASSSSSTTGQTSLSPSSSSSSST